MSEKHHRLRTPPSAQRPAPRSGEPKQRLLTVDELIAKLQEYSSRAKSGGNWFVKDVVDVIVEGGKVVVVFGREEPMYMTGES